MNKFWHFTSKKKKTVLNASLTSISYLYPTRKWVLTERERVLAILGIVNTLPSPFPNPCFAERENIGS